MTHVSQEAHKTDVAVILACRFIYLDGLHFITAVTPSRPYLTTACRLNGLQLNRFDAFLMAWFGQFIVTTAR